VSDYTVTVPVERVALDTCRRLVQQGRHFTCEKTEGGWKFSVRRNDTVAALKIADFEKGQVVAFKPGLVWENGIKIPKLGIVQSVNRQRETISVKFQARVDGVMKECQGYFKPADITGFY
jgi:transcription elongation factor